MPSIFLTSPKKLRKYNGFTALSAVLKLLFIFNSGRVVTLLKYLRQDEETKGLRLLFKFSYSLTWFIPRKPLILAEAENFAKMIRLSYCIYFKTIFII